VGKVRISKHYPSYLELDGVRDPLEDSFKFNSKCLEIEDFQALVEPQWVNYDRNKNIGGL
jgi:hypothetical protein